MKEISSLLQRSKRYLKSAELLLNEGDYESSVSRTYYAMFFCAEAVLLTKGLSFSSHKKVLSEFGKHFVKTGVFPKEMSKELSRAFEKRQLGDYEYTFVIKEDEAKDLLNSARRFVEMIETYLKEEGFLEDE